MLLNRYASHANASTVRRGESTCLIIEKDRGILIEVRVPDELLEWFITVVQKDTGDMVLHDWMEHYAVSGESDQELHAEMRKEIERVLDAIVSRPVRLRRVKKKSWIPWQRPKESHLLECEMETGWTQVLPFLIDPANMPMQTDGHSATVDRQSR